MKSLFLLTFCLFNVYFVSSQLDPYVNESTEPSLVADSTENVNSVDSLLNSDQTSNSEDNTESDEEDVLPDNQQGLKTSETTAQENEPVQQTQDSSNNKNNFEPSKQQQPEDSKKSNNDGKVKLMNAWNYYSHLNPPLINTFQPLNGYTSYVQHIQHETPNFVYQNPVLLQTIAQPNTHYMYPSYSTVPNYVQPYVYYYPQYLQSSMAQTVQHTMPYIPTVNMETNDGKYNSPAVVSAIPITSNAPQSNQHLNNKQNPNVYVYGSTQGIMNQPSKHNKKGVTMQKSNLLSPGKLIRNRY